MDSKVEVSSKSSINFECPLPYISSSKSSNLSEDLAHTTTFAPALASINEVALPMPFDAPHTRAFLPFSIPSA